ncbi:MAG: hypothetical protein EI684_08410 [Candidatus Viridilinea halotolerans]|uniref:HEPN domain-containing protein n=1 Tax=Candidatus Viridilinea halotolerans TaxID=2491704 RepID=A0A426U298_9CHLR|nr:MAG: hypothetical protein EI684_08410 [Candidatus Viridilinea halotolerans]
MPEKVKLDFIEASRCYAAGFYRAAAFFTVRGTETVIGKYYEAVAKKSPGKKTWGPISEDIQKNLRLWGVPEELATEVKKWLTRAMTLYITETIMKPEIISKELKLWE